MSITVITTCDGCKKVQPLTGEYFGSLMANSTAGKGFCATLNYCSDTCAVRAAEKLLGMYKERVNAQKPQEGAEQRKAACEAADQGIKGTPPRQEQDKVDKSGAEWLERGRRVL